MKAWVVIGYIYDADMHCCECTPDDMKYDSVDSEGNPVHPIFAGSELEEGSCCSDCGITL